MCLLLLGFVGLIDGLVIMPLVALWDVVHIERFELPPTNRVWTLLLVNGFIGTVLSELLWLWSVAQNIVLPKFSIVKSSVPFP